MGHVQNNKVISLRSKEDIADLMSSVQKGENILLWCDGLRKETEKKNLRKRGKSKSSTTLTLMMKILLASERRKTEMTKSSVVLKS